MNAPVDLPPSLLPTPGDAPPADAAADHALCAPLLRRLRAAVAMPDGAAEALAGRLHEALAALPAATASPTRVDCLLVAAHVHYLRARADAALASSLRAVALARAIDAQALLRKALTFVGVMHMEACNLPAAVASLAEALAIAQRLGDAMAEAPVWSNLGLALQNAALYEDAIRCHERAAALAGSAEFAIVRRAAYANMSSCALHLQDPAAGIRAAGAAIAMNLAPASAADGLSRVVAESNHARLLLQLGEVEQAAGHAALVDQFARRFPTPRVEIAAMVSGGLVAVHRGEVESGLATLKQALERSRQQLRSEVRDALLACVAGYEAAGQADVALVFLHEIMAMNREARATQALLDHERHLASLAPDEPAPAPDPEAPSAPAAPAAAATAGGGILATLARHRGRLQGRLGEREAVRNRMRLLEEQSVAAELHDDGTGEHCYRVGRLASRLGREIGLEDDVCFLIELAARLHDIGKLVVPDAILLKPGRLTPGERALMETHTTAGAEILARSRVPQMHVAEEIARHHHERWDGSGYPSGLAGTAIPVAARVAALADVFDALTHVRPYKRAWPVADALAEIRRLRGLQFEPRLTDIFLALVPRLQREVGDLDAYLGAEARHSPFIQARRRIAEALGDGKPSGSRSDPPFAPRR